jgi:serine phosphatase RsbU (regulator of sigma subunit)
MRKLTGLFFTLLIFLQVNSYGQLLIPAKVDYGIDISIDSMMEFEKQNPIRSMLDSGFLDFNLSQAFTFLIVFLGVYFMFRTQNLRKTNRILREKELAANEISHQKELISRRNKSIEDSMKYAQRIQSAMLTTPKVFKQHLPGSFILHKPKEIISGDFYWIAEINDKIFLAVADCTGHGIPGAFMSIIGLELFRKIINLQGVHEPGKILDNLNQNFHEIFGSGEDIALRDGMDLAFCVIDKKKMLMQFAGAFNPIYIIRNNKLMEIKGDRLSVGADNDPLDLKPVQSFTSHDLKLSRTDMIYLFTDGFADQFGGPEGKKYKYRRFRHTLLTIHKLSLESQKVYLDQTLEEWRGKIEQIDDILVIGIRPDFS